MYQTMRYIFGKMMPMNRTSNIENFCIGLRPVWSGDDWGGGGIDNKRLLEWTEI